MAPRGSWSALTRLAGTASCTDRTGWSKGCDVSNRPDPLPEQYRSSRRAVQVLSPTGIGALAEHLPRAEQQPVLGRCRRDRDAVDAAGHAEGDLVGLEVVGEAELDR